MIVKQHSMSFLQLFIEMRGSIVPAIMPHILASASLGVFACLVILKNNSPLHESGFKISLGPFTALGVAISLFLGFHNNASYNRWWEARILWGRQVIVTRDITRFLLGTISGGAQTFTDKDANRIEPFENEAGIDTYDYDIETASPSKVVKGNAINKLFTMTDYDHIDAQEKKTIDFDWKENIVRLSVAHTHAFRHQMRPLCKLDGDNSALKDRDRFLSAEERRQLEHCKNPANTILLMASKILGNAHINQNITKVDSYKMIHIQSMLDGLCTIQTACERIHNTSMPLAYSLLVNRTSVLYVLLVPFAIADSVGWWTPVFTAIVAYTFFGLDQLAKEIQEPFRDRPMCLALSAMSRVIEADSIEAINNYNNNRLGRPLHTNVRVPDYLKPQNTILM
jgi:putative membrane protein